jgi:hypothetical protein
MKGIFTDEGADKLWHVLKFITEKPEAHDQSTWMRLPDKDTVPSAEMEWSCGTTACVAGWVTLFDGWKPALPEWVLASPCECDICAGAPSALFVEPISVEDVTKNGERETLSHVAAEILTGEGLEGPNNFRVRNMLFEPYNSIDFLWRWAERESGGYIRRNEVSA